MPTLINSTTPQNTTVGQAYENKDVFSALDTIESSIREGKMLLELGVDTQTVQLVREMLKDPAKTINSVAESLANAYVALFWGLAKTKHIAHIKSIGYNISGSRVSLWTMLEDEAYTFETRSSFYELRASLSNSPVFAGISVDFFVVRASEMALPEEYKQLAIA